MRSFVEYIAVYVVKEELLSYNPFCKGMLMNSPMCKYVKMVAALICILVALDFGLGVLNMNFLLSSTLVLSNFTLVQYLVLASAIVNLYYLALKLQGKKGCKPC